MLLALGLIACSSNEINNPKSRNDYEHSQIMSKIKQYQQEDSLKIAQMKRDIVFYRQALLAAITDLDILAQRRELAKTGAVVQYARDEADSLKQQVLKAQQQQIEAIRTKLFSSISDSLFTSATKINPIDYQNQLAELNKELAKIRDDVSKLDSKVSNPTTEKPQVKPEQPKKIETLTPAATPPATAEEKDNPEAQLDYGNARILFNNGDFQGAIAIYRDFLIKYPKQTLAANAQYWLGEAYYSLEDYQQAITEFEKLVWKYPDSAKAPDAQFKLGLSYLKSGDKPQAKHELEKLKRQYPNYEKMNLVDKYLLSLK